ncbi:MAG: response regulator transcription factor [Deltaproteobacteria bacterium]|nr:response regulator transcription factor [Deltaproteobacteria bacterium]
MARKILVIDDDPDLVAMIKLGLEAKGFEVATAASGKDAMAVLDGGFGPDGIVLDVMMAGRADGMIFARQLRKNAAHKHIPILMLTGMREATGFGPIKDDPRDPVFLPVDVFLEKPIKRDVLLAKIEELLAAHR